MRICLLFTPPTPDWLTEWLSDKKAMKGKNAHATLIKDSFRYHFLYSLLLLRIFFTLSHFPIVIIIIQSHRKAVVNWWYYWIEYKKGEWIAGNLFRLLFHHFSLSFLKCFRFGRINFEIYSRKKWEDGNLHRKINFLPFSFFFICCHFFLYISENEKRVFREKIYINKSCGYFSPPFFFLCLVESNLNFLKYF